MIATIDLVISALIASIVQFLLTDVAQVFISVLVIALIVRVLIMIFHMGKGV